MAKGKYHEWRTEEGLMLLHSYARKGLTDKQIAENAGVAESTLYDWMSKFPEISEAIKKGKLLPNAQVESALYQRAVGGKVSLEKTFKLKRVEFDPKTGKKILEQEELAIGKDEIFIPPDTNAIKFILTNRDPENWRNVFFTPPNEGDEQNTGVALIPAVELVTEDANASADA